jgi:hypothetical protein
VATEGAEETVASGAEAETEGLASMTAPTAEEEAETEVLEATEETAGMVVEVPVVPRTASIE